MAHQLVEGTGQLAARGTTAHDHHRLQKTATIAIRGLLRLLQGREHPSPDLIGMLEDFHRRRQFTPLLVTEVSAAGAGGQDQAVVTQATIVEHHLPVLGIEIDHLTKQHLHIGRLGQ